MSSLPSSPSAQEIEALRGRLVTLYCLFITGFEAVSVGWQLLAEPPLAGTPRIRLELFLGLLALLGALFAQRGLIRYAGIVMNVGLALVLPVLTLGYQLPGEMMLAGFVGMILIASVAGGQREVHLTAIITVVLSLLIYPLLPLQRAAWRSSLAIAALLLGIAVTLSWFIGRLLASIERLRASEGYFQRLSHIDPLTGLGNRRRFDESLRRVLPRSGKEAPTSLLVFDVNSLKTINDLAGHPSGDRALQAVARAIRTSTRETDIAARIGGDEFAVILPHLALSGAKKVAERIRRQLDEYEVDGIDREIVLSVSVGMATATSPDVQAEALLAEADQDLYHGRKHVRRTVQEPALS